MSTETTNPGQKTDAMKIDIVYDEGEDIVDRSISGEVARSRSEGYATWGWLWLLGKECAETGYSENGGTNTEEDNDAGPYKYILVLVRPKLPVEDQLLRCEFKDMLLDSGLPYKSCYVLIPRVR